MERLLAGECRKRRALRYGFAVTERPYGSFGATLVGILLAQNFYPSENHINTDWHKKQHQTHNTGK
jgi:hypothetical protein